MCWFLLFYVAFWRIRTFLKITLIDNPRVASSCPFSPRFFHLFLLSALFSFPISRFPSVFYVRDVFFSTPFRPSWAFSLRSSFFPHLVSPIVSIFTRPSLQFSRETSRRFLPVRPCLGSPSTLFRSPHRHWAEMVEFCPSFPKEAGFIAFVHVYSGF